MIFVCVGSRPNQFNRLIKEIDNLAGMGLVTNVFAQIGNSTYHPKNVKYKRFLSNIEFESYQQNANIVITHAGTGSIVSALKKDKKVIAVPRMEKYNEHIDDHQLEIAEVFQKKGMLEMVTDIKQLEDAINTVSNKKYVKYESNNSVLNIINNYIENI